MMNDLDLAQSLFRKPTEIVTEAFGGRLPAYTVEAEAMEDSADGMVAVQFMGDTVNLTDGDPDGDGAVTDELSESGVAAQWVSVPCSANVKAGDRVLVTIQDGAPIDCTTIGWGDTVHAVASQAEAIATATQQHFWADGNGIHVSTDEGDAAGANNILINSLGILLRELQTVLLELSSAGVIVGDQSGTHLAIDSNSVDVVDGNGTPFLSLEATTATAKLLTTLAYSLMGHYTSNTDCASVETEAESSDRIAKLNTRSPSGFIAVADAQALASSAVAAMSAQKGGSSHVAEITATATASAATVDLTADSVTVSNAAPIVYEDKTVTVGSTAKGTNFMTTVSIAKTGYTPVGVVDWWWDSGTRQNFFNSWGVFTNGNTLYVRLCNLHASSNADGVFKARILYVRDELL